MFCCVLSLGYCHWDQCSKCVSWIGLWATIGRPLIITITLFKYMKRVNNPALSLDHSVFYSCIFVIQLLVYTQQHICCVQCGAACRLQGQWACLFPMTWRFMNLPVFGNHVLWTFWSSASLVFLTYHLLSAVRLKWFCYPGNYHLFSQVLPKIVLRRRNHLSICWGLQQSGPQDCTTAVKWRVIFTALQPVLDQASVSLKKWGKQDSKAPALAGGKWKPLLPAPAVAQS